MRAAGMSHRILALQKFDQLDQMMNDGIDRLKNEVRNLKEEDFLNKSKSLTRINHHGKDKDFDAPIQMLDSLIQYEEGGNNGFSLYHRGQNLK